jgi:hypothetical protein
MEGDVRRSRKPIVAAGGLGLIATFIVGTIVAGWLTEADVGWSLGYVLVRWTRQQPRQRRVPVHGPRLARNGGLSWALLGRTSLARGAIRRLHVDPADANVLLVALSRSNFGRDSNNDPPPPPSHGVYRSTNGGVTWSRIDGPWWSDPFDNIGRSNGRIELAIASSDPDVVYAGIVESIGSPRKGSLLGLFRTDDAWSDAPNWIQMPTEATGPGGYCATPPTELKCEYSHGISVDPRDPNTLFAGGARNLWRCTNCGASPTWTNTTDDKRSVFVPSVQPDAIPPGLVPTLHRRVEGEAEPRRDRQHLLLERHEIPAAMVRTRGRWAGAVVNPSVHVVLPSSTASFTLAPSTAIDAVERGGAVIAPPGRRASRTSSGAYRGGPCSGRRPSDA